MYADDTELDFSCKTSADLEMAINSDLISLETYFNENRLSINKKKCEYMLIGTSQSLSKVPDLNIKIGNENIIRVETAKYLGMSIDQNLRWTTHIENMIRKISSKIGILRRLKVIVPSKTLKLLYNAIIQPQFDYVDVVYDSTTQMCKDRLQRLQTRAARILTGTSPEISRNTIYKELSWINLQNRRNFNKCALVFKCLHGLAPEYLIDNYTFNHQIHSYSTRSANNLHIDKATTKYYSNSFRISSQKLWNNLPSHIKDCDTLNSFKNQLSKHLKTYDQF